MMAPPVEEEATFTVGEVASLFLGTSASWMRYRERQGVLPSARKDGRDRVYTLSDIEAIGDALLAADLVDEAGRAALSRRISATRRWSAEMAASSVQVRDPAGRGPETGGAYRDRIKRYPDDAAKVVRETDFSVSWACGICGARSRMTWGSDDEGREKASRAAHMHNANTHDPDVVR
jgi:DNA-binding transcriptional MerR regulator